MSTHNSTSAATDVAEFITDLDGGQFDRMLSIALSQVAAGTCDNDGKGEVTMKFTFTKVPGASQVICAHALKFTRPTADGKASAATVAGVETLVRSLASGVRASRLAAAE